jgi:hypothetical protein
MHHSNTTYKINVQFIMDHKLKGGKKKEKKERTIETTQK